MRRLFGILAALFLLGSLFSPVHAEDPVVRVVLFFSPTCTHCEKVINQDLPPLQQKYGTRLQIGMVDITGRGDVVYQSAIKKYNLPGNRQGVPTMVIGTTVLVGSIEIPAQLPGLIESGLKAGGVAWPDIPGLSGVINEGNTGDGSQGSLSQKVGSDPANILAIFILIGMVSVFGFILYRKPWIDSRPKKRSKQKRIIPSWKIWIIPALSIVGLGISTYLSYVELTSTQAVCGPVGNCNAVQTSEYARLFGVLPVGVLGFAGNIGILAAWIAGRFGKGQIAEQGSKFLFVFATFGILFSIYLTFLEPFVIGASCAWCLTSAVIMTGIFWFSAETARL